MKSKHQNSRKIKLAMVVSRPYHYQIPLYRKLSNLPDVDLTVYYSWHDSAGKEAYDPDYGKNVQWDVEVLQGYSYKFLKNYSFRPAHRSFGMINPGIIRELFVNKYDAVWVHGNSTIKDWLTFFGAWLSKTPILIRGESNLLQPRRWYGKVIRRIILPLLFKKSKGLLAIGSKNREFYNFYGVPNEKIYHVPYAVDNEKFNNFYCTLRDQKEQIKQKLGLPLGKKVILFVSKIIPRKRPFDLIKAYEKINTNGDFALAFVGDGSSRPKLENYVQQAKLKDVYFFGFQNQIELPLFYTIGDVFVLPSRKEPWGMIVNEAMNFELPIVATSAIGSAHDLVKQGQNGFLYDVGDIDTLADALKTILNDGERAEKMGQLSQKIISEWGYEQDIDGVLNAIERCRLK